ncbi:MAG: acyltransferase [Actinomycetota bacterium]|nr:acyltransferase [Actinomycetota bacterium]
MPSTAVLPPRPRRTLPGRDRAIDLYRSVAIIAVVLGHWLVIGIDGHGGRNLLQTDGWIHPLTWLFQVMPLVFVVAGWSNAHSWPGARQARTWYRRRAGGFAGPVLVYLVAVEVAAALARLAGTNAEVAGDAAWLLRVHLWFVPVYLAVIAVTPLAVATARRWGSRSVIALVAVSAVLDLGRPSLLTWATVWLACHQIGVAWALGSLSERHSTRLALAGGAAAVALVALGPWPLSMVGVPGSDRSNTGPPSIALLALGLAQAGLAVGAAPAVRRWLGRSPTCASVVERVNAASARLYLLHLVPVLIGACILRLGLDAFPRVGTASWWALRPLWLVALALALASILTLTGRRGASAAADDQERSAATVDTNRSTALSEPRHPGPFTTTAKTASRPPAVVR